MTSVPGTVTEQTNLSRIKQHTWDSWGIRPSERGLMKDRSCFTNVISLRTKARKLSLKAELPQGAAQGLDAELQTDSIRQQHGWVSAAPLPAACCHPARQLARCPRAHSPHSPCAVAAAAAGGAGGCWAAGGVQHSRAHPCGVLHTTPLQFRWFQEVTLSHLQSIARNYNISYNIDSRFRSLAEQAEAADAARAALGTELARLAAVSRRLQRSVRRLEGRAPSPHAEPRSLRDAVHSQQKLQDSVPLSALGPRPLKVRQQQQQTEERQRVMVETGPSRMPVEDTEPLSDTEAVTTALPTSATGPQEQFLAPQQPETGGCRDVCPRTECCFPSPVCSVGSVLLFPNTSASDGAVLQPRLHVGLWELSFCTWLLTPAPHLGAVLSYTGEAEASKLALHGDHPGFARFVIGDTEFRQLLVTPLLDGKWHHLCLTWSSSHGQYRVYVDRRLLAAGSGFQQGYEVPAGGLLVLGQQQSHSVGFVPFLGQLAGLALWNRALLPGEVASMATGQGLPHGPLLTLANATLQGDVHRKGCACLQHCP
ncbi:pentraxin-4 [Numida meleagris]|uniref:pentraxin-4 n=1 Tax=Numida meleagris TaxID=8996 RepID=UPI000B3D9435|nr:pentraxin-4 [Numida meleagris]